jgi:D-glycero-alpha-D-manno-heptose-7-phosphate kinase
VSVVGASAPTRIDLAGGTLDIWPLSVMVPGAMTVNLAVELRAHAEVEPRRDGRVEVVSADRGPGDPPPAARDADCRGRLRCCVCAPPSRRSRA